MKWLDAIIKAMEAAYSCDVYRDSAFLRIYSYVTNRRVCLLSFGFFGPDPGAYKDNLLVCGLFKNFILR